MCIELTWIDFSLNKKGEEALRNYLNVEITHTHKIRKKNLRITGPLPSHLKQISYTLQDIQFKCDIQVKF